MEEQECREEDHVARIFSTSPEQTEAYEILQALIDMQWRCSKLVIKTDNLQVVHALQQEDKCNNEVVSIIKAVKIVANTF